MLENNGRGAWLAGRVIPVPRDSPMRLRVYDFCVFYVLSRTDNDLPHRFVALSYGSIGAIFGWCLRFALRGFVHIHKNRFDIRAVADGDGYFAALELWHEARWNNRTRQNRQQNQR